MSTWIRERLIFQRAYTLEGPDSFFSHTPNLDDEIEHHMLYYNLYNEWIDNEVSKAEQATEEAENYLIKGDCKMNFPEDVLRSNIIKIVRRPVHG